MSDFRIKKLPNSRKSIVPTKMKIMFTLLIIIYCVTECFASTSIEHDYLLHFFIFNAVHCTFQLALFRRRMTFVISAKFYSTDHLSRWGSLNSDHWNERASHSNKRNETRYPSFESIKFVHLTPQYPKITLKAVSDKVHPSWILHDSVGSRALSLRWIYF